MTRLYAAHAGYPGDRGDYQGHLTVIDLGSGSQVVFNANCADQAVHFRGLPEAPGCPRVQTGIWARGGVVYDSSLDRIFTATGNGPYNPARHDWADTVLALAPDGTAAGGTPLDSYTPESFESLDEMDADLGSTIPAILPAIPGSRKAHLAVQGGKDDRLRLLDLSNLSGKGAPGQVGGELQEIPVPQGGQVLTAPAVWKDPADGSCWVFVSNGSGISGVQVVAGADGAPRMVPRWDERIGGTSPVIAHGVLFYAGSSRLRAIRPRDGRVLWEDSGIGKIHWESPIVVNGRLYMTDESGNLTAFAPKG